MTELFSPGFWTFLGLIVTVIVVPGGSYIIKRLVSRKDRIAQMYDSALERKTEEIDTLSEKLAARIEESMEQRVLLAIAKKELEICEEQGRQLQKKIASLEARRV